MIAAAVISLLFAASAAAQASVAVTSPNGKIQFRLTVDPAGRYVTVTFRGHTVIENWPIGIVVDDENLADGERSSSELYAIHETYETRGVHSRAAN